MNIRKLFGMKQREPKILEKGQKCKILGKIEHYKTEFDNYNPEFTVEGLINDLFGVNTYLDVIGNNPILFYTIRQSIYGGSDQELYMGYVKGALEVADRTELEIIARKV